MTKATEIREVLEMVTEGPVVREVPEGAKPARGCRCEDKGNTPWLERDEDGQLHCINCGEDYRP